MPIIAKNVKNAIKWKHVCLAAASTPVTNKNIIDITYPIGYINISVEDDEKLDLLDTNYPKKKSFVVIYKECKKPTWSASNTRYTNDMNHAKTYYGVENLKEMAHKVWASADAEDNVDKKVQQSILSKICKVNSQNHTLFALFSW